jgi:acyl transferase domain-containing protein
VYSGIGTSTYAVNLYANYDFGETEAISLGNAGSFAATRVAYKLNLRGPAFNVQTACSTSLVAVHLACQGLLTYDCDIALAGSASVVIPQKGGYLYQEGGILSPDGHCRAFDASAQGTIFGSGVGVVVLKRLADALTDRDTIYAIIRGSAINNDGSEKIGFVAPSINGQAQVVLAALEMAEIEPETVTYVETHGTGTALGDPIEIAGLTKAFRTHTDLKNFCALGSLKPNIGHLDTAAGIASLIKTILALRHKELPPSLHFEEPNPKIDFAQSPFYVNTKLSAWKTNGLPRRAGVTALGFGGTNVHLIVEEAPEAKLASEARPWQVLSISAKSETALQVMTDNLARYLQQHSNVHPADVAYTLQMGRRPFKYRRTVVCQSLNDAVQALNIPGSLNVSTAVAQENNQTVTFLFPGQGTQYVTMALELYRSEQIFRKYIDYCSAFLEPYLGFDLRMVLYPSAQEEAKAAEQLNQTAITQPALFTVEYALAQLWMAWGVRPQAMIGHSIGEYVAACLAGVFSLEDALAVVAARGRIMQNLPEGAMLSVRLAEQYIHPLLDENLSLAAVNGPSLCVVAGPLEAVNAFQEHLKELAIPCHRLQTSHAFHSSMMEAAVEPFVKQVTTVSLGTPHIPFLSNITGTWITAQEATDPSYWGEHLRETVRFGDGIEKLLQNPQGVLLEVGPGKTLSTLAQQSLIEQTKEQVICASMRTRHEQGSDLSYIFQSLGHLWCAGVEICWSDVYAQQRRSRLPLPTYPFERQRCWIEPQAQFDASPSHLLKRQDSADWLYVPGWKRSVLPQYLEESNGGEQISCWIVFMDDLGIGLEVVKRLRQVGHRVIAVSAGSRFNQISESSYTIHPKELLDYDLLLRTIERLPWNILHLWNIAPYNSKEVGTRIEESCLEKGFFSLLFLAQTLANTNLPETIQILIVSSGLHAVTGEEVLCSEQATLLGPCKVISQEYPHISCRSIDFVLPNPETARWNRLIDLLLAEVRLPTSDSIIAYRGSYRWVQTFESLHLDNVSETTAILRKRGVYLITGGLGGIGLELAEYLAQQVSANLVLVGRSDFPKREEWKNWLMTHDEWDVVSNKIRRLQRIETSAQNFWLSVRMLLNLTR